MIASTTQPELEAARLAAEVLERRRAVTAHAIYGAVADVERLAIFMQAHVFAVWDFMMLVKALQITFTCVSVPWTPSTHRASSRFINEIVLGEESDLIPGVGPISHFELYRLAMRECGADAGPIDRVVAAVRAGAPLESAMAGADVPEHVAAFVRTTWGFITGAKPHVIAAAFACGREHLIPACFRKFVESLDAHSPGRYGSLRTYFTRHIDLDEESHGPLATEMLREVCGTDPLRWHEAREGALAAIDARERLWDGILASLATVTVTGGVHAIAMP